MVEATNAPRARRGLTVGSIATVGLFGGVALMIVVFVIIGARGGDTTVRERAQLVDMQQSAQAMLAAGQTMRQHGSAMADAATRANDQQLLADANHWIQDGEDLIQGGQWMAMNPTAPGSLASTAGGLGQQGNWGELNRTARQMLHDPSRASQVDLEALRWNGEAMRAEGRTMADHGRVMGEQVEVMVARGALQGTAADDLRNAARTMVTVGGTLEQNGNAMIAYADQVRKSLGY